MPLRERRHVDKPALFAAALLVAIGGLIYELILGTAASYIIGDSIVSFSIATGVTLFGMGLGSLLASRLTERAARAFVWNEIALGFIGGNSVLFLFAAFSLTQLHWVVFVLLSLVIGILIGLEIPLLMSLFRAYTKKTSLALLSRVLALDYFGALIASLLFPFVLLPTLGLMRTAYAVAALNIIVALYILRRIGITKRTGLAAGAVLVLLIGCFASAQRIERAIDARAYQDPVVFFDFSPYQKIVLTQFKDDTRLYLNNQLQFSSSDEARYHETLAHSIMTSVAPPRDVLVLGGGDGLLARELLKYPSVKSLTIVDIDPKMTAIAKTNRLLVDLNKGAFLDQRTQIRNEDAFTFMRQNTRKYDVIIADLIDPSNERIAKLYSKEFYRYTLSSLTPDGGFITQATSSYFTPRAFATIGATTRAASPDRTVIPLSLNVPSFGEWGFMMSLPAGTTPFTRTPLPPSLSYINTKRLHYAQDNASPDETQAPSTLLHPSIYTVYQADMAQWRY